MIGLFCPSCGCACCNTHRLHDSLGDISWAESVRLENKCGTIAYDLTTDSSGDLYVVGGWWRKVEGVSVRRYQVQKWSAAGVQQWATDIDLQFPGNEWQNVALGASDGPPVPHLNLACDDEHVWLSSRANAVDSDDLWKLDADDGEIVWFVDTGKQIWDICPNGSGGVFAGIRGTDGAGYLAEFDEDGDQVGDAFGECGAIATRLTTDGTAVYAALNQRASCLCFEGHVSKHDIATRELLWQWYRADKRYDGETEPDPNSDPIYSDELSGPRSRQNPVVGLDIAGGMLYVAYVGWTQMSTGFDFSSQSYPMMVEQWDAETAEVLWGRILEKDDEGGDHPGLARSLRLVGITTDGTHVWTGSQLTTYKLDAAGDLILCQPAVGWDLLEADGSGGVYLGGVARSCTPVVTREHLCVDSATDCEKDGTAADVTEIGDTVGGCTIMPGEPSPIGGIIAHRCDAEEVAMEDVDTVTIPCTVPDVFDATQLGPTFTDDAVEFEWVYQEGEFWQAQFDTTCCADGDSATYTITLRVWQGPSLIDEEDVCSHWVLEGAVVGWCDGVEPIPTLTRLQFSITDCWCEGTEDHPHPWFDFEYVGEELNCCAESCAPGGVLSVNCPCERIPCLVPDVFYGQGCLEEITPINHTWDFVDYGAAIGIPDVGNPVIGGRWQTQFNIPCGELYSFTVEMGAVEYKVESGCGWYISGSIIASVESGCLSGNFPVPFTANVTACPCSEESPLGHPWFAWSMTDLNFGESCVCCGEGGGGNTPPGVTVDCCENEIPLTLTAEFTGCAIPLATLTYNSMSGLWESPSLDGTGILPGLDPSYRVFFGCISGQLRLYLDPGSVCGFSTTFESCDPLIVTGELSTECTFCDGAALTFTVTE